MLAVFIQSLVFGFSVMAFFSHIVFALKEPIGYGFPKYPFWESVSFFGAFKRHPLVFRVGHMGFRFKSLERGRSCRIPRRRCSSIIVCHTASMTRKAYAARNCGGEGLGTSFQR